MRRRGARKVALEVLYEWEISGRPLEDVLERHLSNSSFEFTATLVRGVSAHIEELDGVISSYSEDWRIDRMPVIDRNLIRLGAFEILHLADVPVAVTIDEAVELAKLYSTEDSGRFINGLLAAIAAGNPKR